MKALKVWKGTNGRWFWHLKARNGRIVCAGQPRGYSSKQGAEAGYKAAQRLMLGGWRS